MMGGEDPSGRARVRVRQIGVAILRSAQNDTKRYGELNNSRRIVELLTKSPDLISALRRRKVNTLWQPLHNGNVTKEKSRRSSMA